MHYGRQQGAVLIVSLVLLTALTLVVVAGMDESIMQERMAGHLRDRTLALQAAEAALVEAEQLIDGLVTTGAFDGSGGLYGQSDALPADLFDPASWSSGRVYSGSFPGVSSQPRYLIKVLPTIDGITSAINVGRYGRGGGSGDITPFKIIVRGTGAAEESVVVLRAYYGKIF